MLFGRQPKHFKRNTSKIWQETTDLSNYQKIVSESELLFGMHVVRDEFTISDPIDNFCEIAKQVIPGSSTPGVGNVVNVVVDTVGAVAKYFVLNASGYSYGEDEWFSDVISSIEDNFRIKIQDLSDAGFDKYISEKYGKDSQYINSAIHWILVICLLFECVEDAMTAAPYVSSFNDPMIAYTLSDVGFDASLRGNASQLYSFEEIHNAIANL